MDAWQERDQREEDETPKLLYPAEWSSSFCGLAAENSYISRNRAEWVSQLARFVEQQCPLTIARGQVDLDLGRSIAADREVDGLRVGVDRRPLLRPVVADAGCP